MKILGSYIMMTLLTIVLLGALYPLAMVGLGNLIASNGAHGNPFYKGETLVGYENIGQAFYSDKYFWGRPSAVDYDASATGGSNYGNQSPELLKEVAERTQKLLESNPGLTKANIPVELITASGSGLDPHISKKAALIQVKRIAKQRHVSEQDLIILIEKYNENALLGIFGPMDIVNVLKINLALDEMTDSVAIKTNNIQLK